MRKRALHKEFFVEIKKSRNRFLSIFLIVALGVAFFSGIRAAEPDMRLSADAFYDASDLMDLRVVGTLGLTDEDLDAIAAVPGVKEVMGDYWVDMFCDTGDEQLIIQLMSTPDKMNKISVVKGRMPEKQNEILVDANLVDDGKIKIDDTVRMKSGTEDDISDTLAETEFTVVGCGTTAYYLSLDRGTTSIGSGTLDGFAVVPKEAFSMDYYTQICATVENSKELTSYYEDYNELADEVVERIEDIADERCEIRYAEVQEEGAKEIAEGEADIAEGEQKLADAEQEIADAKVKIADGKRELEDGEKEWQEGQEEFLENEQKLIDARKELEDGFSELGRSQKKLIEAEWELSANEEALKEGKEQLTAADAQLTEQETAFASAKGELSKQEAALTEQEQELTAKEEALTELEQQWPVIQEESEKKIAELEQQLADLEQRYQNGTIPEEEYQLQKSVLTAGIQEVEAFLSEQEAYLQQGPEQIAAGKEALAKAKEQLASGKEELLAKEPQLTAARAQLDAKQKELAEGETALLAGKKELEAGKKEFDEGEKELIKGKEELEDGEAQLEEARIELADGKQELEEAREKLADAEQELADGEAEYLEAKAENEPKIADGKQKIADAKEFLEELEMPEWYVLDREYIQTYVEYGQDSERIGAIGEVFPVIFFLVAALVSLTTMTRMVEEQRTQIGTLKALGYSRYSIAGKYILYALLASLLGSLLGLVAGQKLLPYVIIKAYGILYNNLPTVLTPLNLEYSIMATVVAVLCTTLATIAACYKELLAVPAQLMRPAAPKSGKRVFLERIPFIWKRLNFSKKATIRNLVRYKKRFFMTVFGIGGCMALLLVGFGIKDSIMSIGTVQFGEIRTYTGSVGLDEDADAEDIQAVREQVEMDEQVVQHMDAREMAIDAGANGVEKSGYLVVPSDVNGLADYICLQDRKTREAYVLDDEGVIITEKLAKLLDVQPGDTIYLKDDDTSQMEVTVSAVTENYFLHYVYMSPALYEKLYGAAPVYNEIYMVTTESSEEFEKEFQTEYMKLDAVTDVTFISGMEERVSNMLKSMDTVIFVLVAAAGLLAFVVLYNLNNINVTERMRELATLKVLGFYDGEVSAYVNRENVLLTLIGTAAGVVLGISLHRFVIITAEIDMLMFGREIAWKSYLYSILLTFLFSAIVNGVMHFKLKKIDMVESMKSVE